MNKHFEKLLLLFAFLLTTLSAGAQVVLHEDFNQIEGQGGNDDKWNGVNGSKLKATDLEHWSFDYVYRGKNCLKLGSGSNGGTLTTPQLDKLNGEATITLKVGGWNGNTETTELQLSIEGGGTVSPATLSYEKGKFTTLTATITGGTSNSKLTIAAKEQKNNRFFLDLVHIENNGPVAPPRPRVEVTALSQLQGLESNTPVRITFSKENKGSVQAEKGKQESYVTDGSHGVIFSNFLLQDRGWHPTVGGHLAGVIEGEYVVRQGMPTIVANAASTGRGILCLPFAAQPKAKKATTTEMSNAAIRATLVEVDAQLRSQDGKFIATDAAGEITLVDHFGRMNDFELPAHGGQRYHIEGIVGTAENGGTNVLFPTAIREITAELVLNEGQDNQSLLEEWSGRTADVVVNTHLPAQQWSTLVLPFCIESLDETALSDLTIVEWERYEAATQTLHFKTAHSIQAGIPYLVKAAHEVHSIEAKEVKIETEKQLVEHNDVVFTPIYTPFHYQPAAATLIIKGAAPFVAPTVAGTLPAFHAYFDWKTHAPSEANLAIDGQIITTLPHHVSQDDADDAITHTIGGRRIGTQTPLVPGVYLTRQQRIILK